MTATRLLLVHPEPEALAMISSMLRATGHHLIEADNERTALRLLGDPPGLVLLGIDPAEPEALELLRYCRRKHPETPVVLLFTASHPGLSDQALRLGANAVLPFPLTASRLRAAVAQALADGPAPRPSEEARGDEPQPAPAEGQPAGGSPSGATWETSLAGSGVTLRPLKESLEGPERELILQALEAFAWNRCEAAKALDINRTTLYKKIRKYGLLGEEVASCGANGARTVSAARPKAVARSGWILADVRR